MGTHYTRTDLVPAWNDDMDAAPRDGTEILAFDYLWAESGVSHCFWDIDHWQVVGWDCETKLLVPTSWMPLPNPPKSGG